MEAGRVGQARAARPVSVEPKGFFPVSARIAGPCLRDDIQKGFGRRQSASESFKKAIRKNINSLQIISICFLESGLIKRLRGNGLRKNDGASVQRTRFVKQYLSAPPCFMPAHLS
jgi:hypothetical protein